MMLSSTYEVYWLELKDREYWYSKMYGLQHKKNALQVRNARISDTMEYGSGISQVS